MSKMDRQLNSTKDKQTIYEIYRACRLCGAGAGYKMPIIQNVIDLGDSEVELRQKVRECVQIEPDAGECILGLTEPVYVNDDSDGEPLSKQKKQPKVKGKREPELKVKYAAECDRALSHSADKKGDRTNR
ncbi:hypothetical protein HF086_002788 [Spodoptera exigua]|uniref:Uncharacterized protein n=1 Tax=Spodoptera exigua TaxID=7107 RepID=A0A922SK72_SPOEX|nr:hypothetical protein HF086_002788 [Spodoptera exigua]